MPEKIFVALAWPYANGPLHVGHIAGVFLPADIFARYHRLKGNEVLMISGSDCHGTPITLCAEREGITPERVIQHHHPTFLNTFKTLGISFDLFTQTLTENHYGVTQEFFRRLLEKGFIYKETMIGSWTETLQRFLPDRYIQGICPKCDYAPARGDQCDKCGRLHDPWDLIEPRSTLDGLPVTFRQTDHYFLDLARLQPELSVWLESVDRAHWRQNTVQFTQNWLKEGLRGRAITRDLDWGIPVPVDDPSFKTKRFYVWFDAVIGYLSATIEWAARTGRPDKWREWWDTKTTESAGVRSYYFLGKDNIPFHSIVWPAMLIGYGDRTLPYDVPASEFMTLEGERMSTSANWAIWLPDIESRYLPDQIRYYLAANAPEGRDSNWSWSDFIRRNNDDLLGTWGNLAHRVLTIAWRNFGVVPEPGALRETDRQLLAMSEEAFGEVGGLIERVRLKAALQETLAVARRANQYLSEEKPWVLLKTDRSRAATVIYTGLVVVDRLKTLLSPFLPHSSQRLHELLGYEDVIASGPEIEKITDPDGRERPVLSGAYRRINRWEPGAIPIGQTLRSPAPLFQKLEESVIEEERERLRRQSQRS
jgi:methionyl-tRNA synthetase